MTVADRWSKWTEETHAAGFELRRHFFARFLDSDLVSAPGQMRVVAFGALGVVASLSIIFTQAYFVKYRALTELDNPEPYRLAAQADHLFAIVLSMTLTGLLTALEWPSLFPGLGDYLALAGLPIRPRQIFIAKLTALAAFVALFIVALNLLPSMTLPAVMAGRYQPSGGARLMGLLTSTNLAGLFVFFCVISIQGVLLNLVPARHFPRVSLLVQGALFIVLLGVLPIVFSIPGSYQMMDWRPEWLTSLPPIWFLGIDQWILGNDDPLAVEMARMALAALGASAVAALAAYFWSYKRHRVRVLETPIESRSAAGLGTRLAELALERAMPDQGERGIFAFIAATLGRSRQHRMVLTFFVAIAGAVVAQSFLSLLLASSFRSWEVKTFALRQAAVSAPLALSLFSLAGYRYLFRLPVELRANWLFQMSEGETRHSAPRAVERFVLWWGAIPVALLTLPIEIAIFDGLSALGAAVLCLMPSLILIEFLLFEFHRIPFTSAYLPGQRPVIETVMIYAVSVVLYVSIFGGITVWCLENVSTFLIELGLLVALWARMRKARREEVLVGKLEFEERMEPVVLTLAIERD